MKKTLIAVLMALLPFSVSAQGNKEINELDAATSANATDKLAADQSGTLKYLTLTQIGALLDDLIAANSITEVMLKSVNAPTDEYCFTYEATVGDFEWQACSSSAGDITTIGDCTTGDCFDGYGSGAQLIFETAGSDVITLSGESASSTQNLTLPAESGVLLSINTTAVGDVTGNYGALAVGDLTIASEAQGDILYFNGTNWVRLAPGTDGYYLETNGAAANPAWSAVAAGGDSVSVDGGAVVDPDFVSTGDIDFVDTSNDITANLNADVVAAAEMADADHGDVEWTSGVASVEGVNANSVALTTDTTGNYVASVTDGDGIVGADGGSEGATLTLAVDVIDDGDAQTATTSSESGLEFVSTEMGLIRGCDNGEVLKWDETQGDWDCSADSTGGSPTFDAIASGTNTTADMVVGNGAEIELAEGGEVEANEVIIFAQNETGATIYKCSAVHIHDFDIPSALPEIVVADADDGTLMPATGILYETITDGASGRVMLGGILLSADTSTGESWSEGDRLYVNDSGTSTSVDCAETLTSTKPANTDDAIQAIGTVVRAHGTAGKVVVSGAGRANDVPVLQDNYFWLGNGTNVATAVTMSGDVTMTNTGVTALGNDVVAPAEMADADHGDVDWSSGNATVQAMNADIVTSTEMGDDDHGDVNWTSGVATVQGVDADSVALSTDTTGSYAGGNAEAGDALSGDTATAFFDAGTIEHEYGGLEANLSAYNGLVDISGGTSSEVANLAELNTAIGSGLVTGAHTVDSNLTEEEVEDFVGGMVTGNTETNIAVTYEDGDGTLDFVVTASLMTKDHCITVADPATDDEWYTVWRAPTAITITEIYCEMTGGTSVALDLEIDDGTPAAVNGSAITCDASELDSTLAGDTGMADGDRLDLDLGTVTGSVTQLSVCFEYTID